MYVFRTQVFFSHYDSGPVPNISGPVNILSYKPFRLVDLSKKICAPVCHLVLNFIFINTSDSFAIPIGGER